MQLLKNANLFAISLDDKQSWYRYHHLFRNLLERRLERSFKPEEIRVLHTNASTWFSVNGHFEDAIEHALAGGDVQMAAGIVGHARHDHERGSMAPACAMVEVVLT